MSVSKLSARNRLSSRPVSQDPAPRPLAGAEPAPPRLVEEVDEHDQSDASTDVDPPDEVLPGQLWICGSPIDWAWVRDNGITTVTDVADPGPDPRPAEVAGIDVQKQTLTDAAEVPSEDELRPLVERTACAVRGGERALVACSFGRNRSGLVVALTVRELLGCTGPEALDLLRQRRHRAVNNPTFSAFVSRLGRPGRTEERRAG